MKSIIKNLPHAQSDWHCDLYSDTLGLNIKIEKILFHKITQFQDIKICQTKDFGKILLLNNYIYRTEKNNFMVPEMIAHVPMRSGTEKKKVLLIGCGDGYTLNELIQYKNLEKIDAVDIDKEVIKSCKKYFPIVKKGFSDPRVKIHISDGYDFIKKIKDNSYDLILITGTEGKNLDESPGISFDLFTEKFFKECSHCLTKNGIFLIDGSTVFFDFSPFNYVYLEKKLKKIYKITKTYTLTSGTLISGLFAITIASNTCDPENDINSNYGSLLTKYYNPKIHKASFALPQLMLDKLKN